MPFIAYTWSPAIIIHAIADDARAMLFSRDAG